MARVSVMHTVRVQPVPLPLSISRLAATLLLLLLGALLAPGPAAVDANTYVRRTLEAMRAIRRKPATAVQCKGTATRPTSGVHSLVRAFVRCAVGRLLPRVISTGTGVLIPANLTIGVGDSALDVLATFAAQSEQIRALTVLSASQGATIAAQSEQIRALSELTTSQGASIATQSEQIHALNVLTASHTATIAALLLRLEALEAADQNLQTNGTLVAARVSTLEGQVGHVTAASSILGRLTLQDRSLDSINATASTLTNQVTNLETLRGASTLVATLTNASAPASLVARIGTAEAKSLAPEAIGTIVWRASTYILAGYLPCDGASLSRLSYATLFAVLGTTFGSKDASSFSLPDLRGRVVVGSGPATVSTSARALGSTFGQESHTLTSAEMPSHSHGCTIADPGHLHDIAPYEYGQHGSSAGPRSFDYKLSSGTIGSTRYAQTGVTCSTQSQGSNSAHNNLQPSLVLHAFIRA